ncbi:MAG: SPFH domain-containing protein [Gallionella sp.]|nr:SPFH domain-containing protein [Gallionella sp.]
MLGIRFIKSQPTTYLIEYKSGKVARQGLGLSFFYFAPTTTLAAIPAGGRNESFIFQQVTTDFQTITVQGQVAYRISEPTKVAAMLNFALKADGKGYESDEPEKLRQRVLSAVEVLSQKFIKAIALKEALLASDKLAEYVTRALHDYPEITELGIEIQGVLVLAIKPTPETARALEAEAREMILRQSDEAIFVRRNAAIENERRIRQSELDTEIAVEQKKRMIRETQMEAEASIQRKKQALRDMQMEADVILEEKRKALVAKQAENTKTIAEAEAHRVAAVMQALENVDPRIVQALSAAGMQPNQLIAQAFVGIAERADKIGQFNMSPDLLQTLLNGEQGNGR